MVNSIRKGKTFERYIAKLMTQRTGEKWERVPCSGGFATSQGVQNNVFKGDVFCEAHEYKNLVIECKSYKELKITEIFNKDSKLYKWIKQSVDESDGNEWILFVKIDRLGIYEIYNYDHNAHDIAKYQMIRLPNDMIMRKIK